MRNRFPYDKGDGLYRIPHFRDAHMHFMIGGLPAPVKDVLRIGEMYAENGIFSVNDMGHRTGIGMDAKSLLAGKIVVRTAGAAICKKGSYGEFLGKSVGGKEEIKKAVKEVAEAGVDFIKVINSGLVTLTGMPTVTAGGFTSEELGIIREEAIARNLDVVCHANSDAAVRDAVVAGATSIEHGFFVSVETLHMMAESKVSWTPTVIALSGRTANLAGPQKRYAQGVIESHLISISTAASLGVRLQTGTDSGSRGINHGESFIGELRLFRQAGLTEGQILSAACMDISEIEKGNYLTVSEDFIETGKIEGVYGNGERIIRQ